VVPSAATARAEAAKFTTSPASADMPAHKEIKGLSNHRENAGEWANQPYKFTGKKHYMNAEDRAKGKVANVGQLGCTMTAYANAASVLRQKNPSAAVPTPGDANDRNGTFNSAINSVKWTPLTREKHGKFDGTSVEGRTAVFTSSGTPANSEQSRELMAKIYDSVSKGRPVVLGMHGNSAGGVRHTVVVTGIVEGGKRGEASALVVRDQWRGQGGSLGSGVNIEKPTAAQKDAEKTTLDKTMTKNYGAVYTQIDMAMEASPR
jgi:hypothetical protein